MSRVDTSPTPPPTPAPAGKHQIFCRLAARYIIPASSKPKGLRVAFDGEADALLDAATKMHCIVVVDLDSDRIDEFGPNQIDAALARLSEATYLVGHNILGFDLPVLQRLHGWAPQPTCTIVDTLIVGRLILANVLDLDMKAEPMGAPPLGKLHGRFSLEAWGARLGIPKVGAEIEDFSQWSPELQARCVGDARLAKTLHQFLQPDGQPPGALALEHRVAPICERITTDGIPFDRAEAEERCTQWTARLNQLELKLQQQFPQLSNLNSRQQIARLLEERGWVPEERTEKTGQPKIDDEILEDVVQQFPEFDGLAEHYILGRRLGQLANGKKAWLNHIGPDQRIHGGLIHIGTPHHRAKHLDPNLAQVPNPKKGKPLATECRALFRTQNKWLFVCCDQAGLQDRAFAHYLAEFDGGAYARAFVGGLDTHWASVLALGLVQPQTARDKANKFHTALREGAKSFRYGFLFGAQAKRAGIIIRDTIRAAMTVNPHSDLIERFFRGKSAPDEQTLARVGREALDRFEAATPGLRQLRESLRRQANQYGWLPGLDGRRIPVQALYTVLNYAVTSAEAVICKYWLVAVYDELHARFRYGWDSDVVIVAWTHDEIAACCRPEISDQVGEIMVRHAKAAGEHFAFRCPLDADFSVGRSWAGEAINKSNKTSATPELPKMGIVSGSNVELDTAGPDIRTPDQRDSTHDETKAPIEEIFDSAAQPLESLEALLAQYGGKNDATTGKHDQPKPAPPPHPRQTSSTTGSPHGSSGQPRGQVLARFVYDDPNRTDPNYLLVEKRIDGAGKKAFWQYHRANGSWVLGVEGTYAERKIPYRLGALKTALAADPNFELQIAEGEKDAETLAGFGLVATTNPGGANQFTDDIVAWLRVLGVSKVVLHEDNDEAGRKRTAKIASGISNFAAVRVVRYTELPEGGDVTDWVELGHSQQELRERIAAAEVYAPELDEWDTGDDMTIPDPRPWIMGGQFCRTFLSGLVAPGASGKTALRITQAIGLAANKPITSQHIFHRRRVLIVSFEDDRAELNRRILATCMHHGIPRRDLKGWLFAACPKGLKLLEMHKGDRVVGALEPALRRAIERRKPDLVILDPFVKLHALGENDNAAMDAVADLLVQLAHEYNIAIDSPAHTRKGMTAAGDADARRGASAVRDASRLDYTLIPMSEDEADAFGIMPEERRFYLRLDSAKVNLLPPAASASWFRLVDVRLGNCTADYPEGDQVQTVESWTPPDMWAGMDPEELKAVLEEINAGLPNGQRYSSVNAARGRAAWPIVQQHFPYKTEVQCKGIIRAWMKKGVLYEENYEDPVVRRTAKGLRRNPDRSI
jgi:DNA polymerase I-like protein with 3'-5' exonuclease and polymerase domains